LKIGFGLRKEDAMPNAWPLPRSTPEAQGIASQVLERFVSDADQQVQDIHSLMVLRHGHVLCEGYWEPYDRERLHAAYSLTKSVVSTAIGMAISEGLLKLDDPVISFFGADELPSEISENLAAMTIHDLLSMNTGHEHERFEDPLGEQNWARAFLHGEVKYKPGSHFLYNSGASYMLGVILQQLTGQSLREYLQPRFFGPLGIDNFTWVRCPRGFDIGGYGLELTTDSIARLGQLYLQRGQWQGQQLVPAEWVDLASSYHSDNSVNGDNDWGKGYGYQFWLSRHNSYRGDGAFGQCCLIVPDYDLVVAATSGTSQTHILIDLVWQYILPACSDTALPEDAAAVAALEQVLAAPRIAPVQGQASSARAAEVSGKTFVFEPDNTAKTIDLRLEFGDQLTTLVWTDKRGTHTVELGFEQWHYSKTTLNPPLGSSGEIAAVGAWTDEDTFVADICFLDGPFRYRCTAHFIDADTVEYGYKLNASFVQTDFGASLGKSKVLLEAELA
jgi:CubicO group peptidase (beta-lactamase class C family)